jgi:molecular chaperone Hsp33
VSDPIVEFSTEGEGTEIRSYFVRGRNALLVRADVGDLFVNYYLHLAAHQLRYSETHDTLFKESMTALLLHCTGRPWNEHIAWTINFQEPLVNIFVVGDNVHFGLSGQVFTEHVRQGGAGLFYADVVRGGGSPRRSMVEFTGHNPFEIIEGYYRQSEQRPARYFQVGPEDYVFISAQPGCDEAWLESLTIEAVQAIDQTEVLGFLEKRFYQWRCGCGEERMMTLLAPSMLHSAAELFGDETSLRMSCPRCGARYVLTREAMEAFCAEKLPPKAG